MAAHAQATVSRPKYRGSSTDNWTDFESLFRSIVHVTEIQANQRVGFLKFLLNDSALVFPHIRCNHKIRPRVNNRSIGKLFLLPEFEGNSPYQPGEHEIYSQN